MAQLFGWAFFFFNSRIVSQRQHPHVSHQPLELERDENADNVAPWELDREYKVQHIPPSRILWTVMIPQ